MPVQLHQPHGRAAATARSSQMVGPEAFASKPALSPEIDVGAVAAHYGLAALSPLERQVVALKAEVPGCLLLAEVGYKYCAFGEDAEVLSAVLHVSHFTKQHMLVAGFPTRRSRAIRLAAALVAKQPVCLLRLHSGRWRAPPAAGMPSPTPTPTLTPNPNPSRHRLAVHLQRLLCAGHRVAVAAQVERAAEKAVGGSPHSTFARRVSCIHTYATYAPPPEDTEWCATSSGDDDGGAYVA